MFARFENYLVEILSAHTRVRYPWLAVMAGGLGYGAIMGSFGGFAEGRWLQMVYSACKVPFLIGFTALVSLPSFFVLNTLCGLRADFRNALGAILATQAAVGVILGTLAPLTAVLYLGIVRYPEAVMFNGVMFAVASVAGQWVLRKHYHKLILKNHRHRWMFRFWIFIYAFVGIQLGWVLRPFIGDPFQPPSFFRDTAWGNAYVVVWDMVRKVLIPKNQSAFSD